MMDMDSIKFMSKHMERIPEIALPKSKRDDVIREWLVEFHSPSCSDERRDQLKGNIVHAVYFLYPYYLKGKLSAPHMIQDDIVQIMVVNTIEAIYKFDITRETKFTSYIVGYLKNAIATAYKDAQVVRNPAYVRREVISALERVACGKPTEDGAYPTDKEIDTASTKLSRTYPETMYIEDMRNEFSASYDNFSATKAPERTAEHTMLVGEQVHVLAHVLSDEHPLLSAKEKIVLRYRFGVFGQDKLTLEEVSRMFKLKDWNASKEWIFQLQNRALNKVRAEFTQFDLTSS